MVLAIGVLGAAAWAGVGISRGAKKGGAGVVLDGLDQPVASLPPVLLPATVVPSDLDSIRFGVGLRGYRMDQVDQVLDELREHLALRDAEVTRLTGLLADGQAVAQGKA